VDGRAARAGNRSDAAESTHGIVFTGR
jgi:hypothetical protein